MATFYATSDLQGYYYAAGACTSLYVGALVAASMLLRRTKGMPVNPVSTKIKTTPTALSAAKYQHFQVKSVVHSAHNAVTIRFNLSSSGMTLGLPIGRHVSVRAGLPSSATGKLEQVVRSYTPVSAPDAQGYFDLLVRVYDKGKMSQHLASLRPGDTVEMRGPTGSMKYLANKYEKGGIGLVGAGSGVTPLLQMVYGVLDNKDDRTPISLLMQNREERDVLMKGELEQLKKQAHDTGKRFDTVFALSRPNDSTSSTYARGYLTKCILRDNLPAPGPHTLVCLCGPDAFVTAMKGVLLNELGYESSMLHIF